MTESTESLAPHERQARRNWPTSVLKRVARVAAAGIVGVGGIMTADSLYAYHTTYRETIVQPLESTPEEQALASHDERSVTLFLNGLGLDIACEQAEAIRPVAAHYGRVACLWYPSDFDTVPVSEKIYQTLFDATSTKPQHLTIVASSMGDVRGYQIAAELNRRHDITIENFVVNTGPGPLVKERVRDQGFRDMIATSCGKTPGKLLMAAIEVVNQTLQQKQENTVEALAATVSQGLAYNNRVVSDQLCDLNTPLAIADSDKPVMQNAVYILPDDPARDTIVDVEGAARDWREVIPVMEVVHVGHGVTHDNISYRPEVYSDVLAGVFEKARDRRVAIERTVKNPRLR